MTEKEKAIEWLKACKETNYRHSATIQSYIDMAISALSENKGEWIPVSERMPEEPYACMVTIWDTNRSTQEEFENVLHYPVGYDGETWNDAGGNICPYEVIAWRPLLKPYKEGGE